jgi:cell pole-organizing protein PopZ
LDKLMADDKGDEEPSIEEILSSIRDIISDDDEEGAKEAKPAEKSANAEEPAPEAVPKTLEKEAPAPEPAAVDEDDDDDVLELTDVADEDEPAAGPVEENVTEETPITEDDNDPLAGINLDHPDDDDLEVEDGVDDILGASAAEPDVSDIEDIPEPDNDFPADTALVDRVAETATVGAMVKLAENIAIAKTAQGVTLEDIVRDALRPMLKDWLDENLPTLIERLVSQELERLANKAAGK